MDKETVDRCRREAEESYQKLMIARSVFERAQEDYLKKSRRFRDYDYQLAKTDGRLKVLPPSERREKKNKPVELSIEQILRIAEKLGINLNSEPQPEEESTNDLDEQVEGEEALGE